MKKFFSIVAALVIAVSASAAVIWSESLDKNGTYIDKKAFSGNWPYATQWYEAGNFVYAYDSIGSYSCSIRNKKVDGASEYSIGFYYGANKAADSDYLYLGGKDGAIVTGAKGCKLMFNVCSPESDGGDLSTMIIKVNGTALTIPETTLGAKLVTSAIELTLADGDINNILIAFDNVPAQKFITNLRIEGEEGKANGEGGYTPTPVALDTITAAKALEIAKALEVDKTQKVAVKAYIASVKTEYSSEHGNITVWLTDDASSTYGDIQAYRANVSAEYGPVAKAGDLVLVVGYVAHTTYTSGEETKHSYQIAQGAEMTLLSAAQGIEEVELTEKAQKVMVDGVVYIVRDNKMFNLQGVQVR